jgi:uroporphyrin-III C-methyltransferase/precorrin-2 dehydrogenase/sirohydrochlorin ferrochelatase
VQGRRCLVVGGGTVGARKAALLNRFGARVVVAAAEVCSELRERADRGEIEWAARAYDASLLEGATLVFAATDDTGLNRRVAADADALGIPVNVADSPALCTFIVPSIVDRSPVIVAVSSSGQAPVLARLLRARLETFIPSRYGDLARLMGRFRERVRKAMPKLRVHRFWEEVVQGPIAELLLSGQERAALDRLENMLDEAPHAGAAGEVYLVGAGPGEPDLLTFRALRLMQQADIVLYDRLVAPALLDLVRREAKRVYVGKERNRHASPQEDINAAMVSYARAGLRVLRLKGGDPFTFGRGGEEIETLAEAGIPFQVVPGITAALGCASYAGIPLTHRDYASSCLFVTAHLRDGSLDLNWPALIQPRQTLAIYMGVHALAPLCGQLIAHGMSPDMPAAVIERGTLRDQRVLTGTLATLPDLAAQAGVRPPAMTIVGEDVRLRNKLEWFERSKGTK